MQTTKIIIIVSTQLLQLLVVLKKNQPQGESGDRFLSEKRRRFAVGDSLNVRLQICMRSKRHQRSVERFQCRRFKLLYVDVSEPFLEVLGPTIPFEDAAERLRLDGRRVLGHRLEPVDDVVIPTTHRWAGDLIN